MKASEGAALHWAACCVCCSCCCERCLGGLFSPSSGRRVVSCMIWLCAWSSRVHVELLTLHKVGTSREAGTCSCRWLPACCECAGCFWGEALCKGAGAKGLQSHLAELNTCEGAVSVHSPSSAWMPRLFNSPCNSVNSVVTP
jgi:hypothetical protein